MTVLQRGHSATRRGADAHYLLASWPGASTMAQGTGLIRLQKSLVRFPKQLAPRGPEVEKTIAEGDRRKSLENHNSILTKMAMFRSQNKTIFEI